MESSSPMTQEELEKAVREMIPHLKEMMSNVTGTKVRGRATEEGISQIASFILFFAEFAKMMQNVTDEQKRKEMINKFFDILSQIGEAPLVGNSSIEAIISQMEKNFEVSAEHFLSQTEYAKYRDALFQIIDESISKGKLEGVEKFLATISEDDRYGISQLLLKLPKDEAFLQKQHSATNKTIIDRYIEISDNTWGLMEKYVRILTGLRMILEGQTADYQELKKVDLANLLGPLKKAKPYSIFVRHFNIIMRNSNAHKGSTIILPYFKSVKFVDNTKSIKLAYPTFIKQVREMYGSVLILTCLQMGITLRKLISTKEYLSSQGG